MIRAEGVTKVFGKKAESVIPLLQQGAIQVETGQEQLCDST